ncbi:MAG: hypothetical protein OXR84_12200, partial [Magnetovibrio sp.]|nr:hypothetical protein [Magnetovibrio sp.]
MQAQETTKLYLCSGGADVRAYRDGLAAALSGIPEIDLVRPEDFGADNPAPGWAAARECGLFIAVMGHCYGALDPASGKSFTERELELAAAEGIPFHAYLAPGDFMVPAHLLTADSDPARQDALRQRTGAERGFSQMETPDDLARTVIGAVRRWLAETGTDAAADPSAPAGPPAPAPPEPDFAAPRFAPPLFAGRDDERRRLDTWWAAPAAVGFAIDGPMGVGKSALAQAWLDGGFDAAPPEGVVYWSFRNAPGNFRALAERVLTYMGRDETAWSTAHARLDHLGQCLRDHRLLVVLDDFETELRDDGRDARSCRSHETAAFLRLLNAAADMPMRGKVLIVTRHPPAELEIAETSRLTLGGLPAAAAEVLATPEIAAAATACENHPLALRLLAGLAGAGDDISRLKPDQARARTLAAAHEALPAEARGVLAILAASRTPISPKLLAVAHADDGDLDAALGRLAKHGFLDRSAADGTVGMHPGLAADVYGRIGDPAAAHERLCAAYRHASADRPDAIRRLDDMGPLIELFHHTAAAGRPDDAYKLFSGRMANWLQYRFGDHETIAALLESLIPADGVPHPNLSSATEQGRCLTHLAQALRRTGNRQRLTAIEVATT